MDNLQIKNNKKSNQVQNEELSLWSNTYHLRTLNLLNFPNNSSSHRINYRTVMNRARIGIVTSAAKSLNILRQTLQNSINKEINQIIQTYIDRFFRPSVENIKKNFGNNSVSEQHIQAVCRQILEEAKKMYFGPLPSHNISSPINGEAFDNFSDNENFGHHSQDKIKKKPHCDNDSDSESGSLNFGLIKPISIKKKKLKSHHCVNKGKAFHKTVAKSNASESVKREGPKWDPNRLSEDTKFVLGSKANKALGFGATRGRLYTKHADLFRYIGDQEDKQWLHERGLMPPAGGRAYLIIMEDIHDLLESEEYKKAPGVNPLDMGPGFTVPLNMINKMKYIMQSMKNDDTSSTKVLSKSKETHTSSSFIEALSKPLIDSSSLNNNSKHPLVNTNRTKNREISLLDDFDYINSSEMPSTNPSPFSINGSNLSSNPENQESISPITCYINSNLNDV